MAEDIKKPMLKKKEFRYRGKSTEELKQLDIREFARLLKSNERRTALRQTDELQRFILKCKKNSEREKLIKTHSRELLIIPQMIGLTIQVYTGKAYTQVPIVGEMLGHRLGEFAVTRTKVKHGAAGVGATRSSASMSVK